MNKRIQILAQLFKETHLGDGLYCRVDEAGQFVLRAPREDGDHIVFLEPATLDAFQEHVTRMKALIAELRS